MTPEHTTHNPSGSEGAAETLRRLEARLAQVSQAAEGLFERAAESAAAAGSAAGSAAKAGAGAIPPAGWQIPSPPTTDRGLAGDLELVVRTLRELIPPELERRLAEAIRELLLAVRALIDWYLERAERGRAAPSEVQDIPIL